VDAGVGGQLQGISLDSFLQMVQMEKTTCTLKVVSGKREGLLYILNGDLIAAETQDLQNMDAACAIISWDDTVIEIDNSCSKTENEINQPLMHVLMEGLKLKGEKSDAEPDDGLERTVPSDAPATAPEGDEAQEEAEQEEDSAKPTGRDLSKESEEFELHVAPKKEGGLPKVPIILGIVIIAAAAAYFFLSSPGSQSPDQVYQDTMAQVDLTDDTDEQIRLLTEFLNTAGDENEWARAARIKITELKTMQANAAYLEVSSQAEALAETQEYAQAAALYVKHLRSFPGGPNANEVKTSISKLSDLAEKTDYAAATAATASGSIKRIDAYRRYLKHHPEGQKIAEVKKLISAMEGEYFAYTEKQIAKAAMLEEWEKCTQQVEKYSAIYPDSPKTEKLEKFLPLFEKNRLEFADYEKAVEKAQAAGTDYARAHRILSDYLQSFPNTHMASKLENQIAHYKKMDEETKINARIASLEKLLAQSQGRFNSNGNGTFTDKRTGLIWSTLDSKSVLDSCLNYESANTYIKSMNTGGHGDWRLPTPGELKTLFKVEPYFPATPATWLWTSKVLRKYEGEWLIDVTVVTADNNPSPKKMVKDSRLCENVRAVRRASR